MSTTTIKVLGQIKSALTTLESVYAVPASTEATVSTITVCNQSSVATSFRILVDPANAGTLPENYIYYDVAIAGNDTFACTFGITLQALSVIRVYATLATLSFNVYGVEIS